VKILIIHNRYQQRGGEDTTYEQELELLTQTEEVKTIIFQNANGWRGALQFFFCIWNIRSASKIRRAIVEFNPDIVHVHNWYYAIGPLVIRTVHKMGIPVVLTIQNFRLLCPSSTLLYKGDLFLDSIHASFPWKAVWKKLYRNSFILTLWLAFIIWFHKKKGTWKMTDRYILQTELAKSVYISSSLGTRESQFSVKPNFIRDPLKDPVEREQFFLYVGRLASEKGIDTLLEAFVNTKQELYIGGDGPLKQLVLQSCNENPNIRYLGMLDKNTVNNRMRRCSALIFPSVWYEGMPLTLIEAFSLGTPVIASNLGAMSSMIRDGYNGFHFSAGNSGELSEKISDWVRMGKSDKIRFSENARREFELLYTPEHNKEQILSIYRSVMGNKVC
jgi:glycosyltransferase involved in cell wall biosynthesis